MKDELQNHLIKVMYKKLSNYSKKKERKNRLGVNRTFWFHYDKWWSQWKEGLFPLWAQLIKSSVSNIHLPISLLHEQSLSLSLTHTQTHSLSLSLYTSFYLSYTAFSLLTPLQHFFSVSDMSASHVPIFILYIKTFFLSFFDFKRWRRVRI
jgi:hypothetical protein